MASPSRGHDNRRRLDRLSHGRACPPGAPAGGTPVGAMAWRDQLAQGDRTLAARTGADAPPAAWPGAGCHDRSPAETSTGPSAAASPISNVARIGSSRRKTIAAAADQRADDGHQEGRGQGDRESLVDARDDVRDERRDRRPGPAGTLARMRWPRSPVPVRSTPPGPPENWPTTWPGTPAPAAGPAPR